MKERSESETEDWHRNLVENESEIEALVKGMRRVAVLGIRTVERRFAPAYYVPEALARGGIDIVPVPVHPPFPEEILGSPVFRTVAAIPGRIDVVDVFRRSEDLPAHLADLLASRPGVVWFQSGIRNDQVAEALARAGIRVVSDRCLMVDHRRYGTGG